MRIPVFVAALAFAAAASATDRPCTKADAAGAGKAIDRVDTWEQLRKAYQEWGRCDSGETADAFTDALLRLAVDWKNPDAMASAMRDDRGFHDFVIAHLKSDAAKDDRPSVYSRAKKSCPAAQDAFCAEIADATAPAKAETLDLAPMTRIPEAPKKK